MLRVGPRTYSRLAEASHHEANGCEAEECERGAAEVFPVLRKAAPSVEPCDGAFDDPTPSAEPFTRLHAVSRDTCCDTSSAQPSALEITVVRARSKEVPAFQ